MVGVFLLITSVTVAVGLQSRDDPSANVDTAMAMDQAAATTQTLLRAATSDATKAAASEPVTVPAETPAGNALESSGGESVFRRYVKLRVYLELQERLQSSAFESNGATTRMSLPRIDYSESSIEAAIDRVSLEVGSDPGTPDVDPGTVRATVEDVEYEVTADGDRVGSRTNDVTVSVGTTTFLLHDRVRTYRDRLNSGALDGSGFGRQFAARLYPVMYGKAYYERMAPTSNTPAFKKLIPKKDTAVLANSAVYAVQRGTFGAEDPAADVLKLRSYSCFGARNLQKILSKRSGSSGGNPYDRYGIAQRVCQVGKFLTGGPSGSPPGLIQEVANGMMPGGGSGGGASPGTTEHASDQLSQGREVTIDRFADPAYDEIRGNDIDISDYRPSGTPDDVEGSEEVDTDASLPEGDISEDMVSQVVDQIYSVDVDVSTGSASRISGTYPDPDPPSGSDWSRNGDASRDVVSSDVDVDHSETWRSESGRTRTFHEFTVTITNDIEDTQGWRRVTTCSGPAVGPCYEYDETSDTSTVTFEVDVTVTATHSDSDDIDVDHLGIDHAYRSGGDPVSLRPGNFEETPRQPSKRGSTSGRAIPRGTWRARSTGPASIAPATCSRR